MTTRQKSIVLQIWDCAYEEEDDYDRQFRIVELADEIEELFLKWNQDE